MNVCMFAGRLGKPPETRFLPNGQAMTKFAIAVNDFYKGRDGSSQKTTTWIDFTAFGKLGETITQLCTKGSHVTITARYTKETKEVEGAKRTYHNFVVEKFELNADGRSREESAAEETSEEGAFGADDIPF